MDYQDFKNSFLQKLDNLGGIQELFENVPDIYFWIKDNHGRFVMANQAVIELCGCTRESEFVGKTDFDIFPKEVADHFLQDDEKVKNEKHKIINRVELIPQETGGMDWYTTNKVPVFGKNGEVIGVAGISRSMQKENSVLRPYMEMSNIIDYITSNYQEQIDIKELAKMAALSVSQFERKFKKIYQLSPLKFIIRVRVKAACKDLVTTQEPISNIALKNGFYDQSYFSRQITEHMGMSPREYRKKFYRGGG